MNRGDVYMAFFPFGGTDQSKPRPVLLLTGAVGNVPEFLTASISTVAPNPMLNSDLVLDPSHPDYASTNLRLTSVLRLHKLATLHQRRMKRKIGELSPGAQAQVDDRLRTLLNL